MSFIVNKKDLKQLLKTDHIFRDIHLHYGIPPNWNRPKGFVTLAKIIIGQQVSLASADAHFSKLNNYIPGFTPAEIIKLTDKEMRECQITRQKANYLRCLSNEIMEGKIDLDKFDAMPFDEVRKSLKRIKGIGDWTADIYLMLCLQAKDIFPVGDVAVITTMKEFTNASTLEQIKAHSEKWKPLRSLATYFLWHYYLKTRNRTFEN